MRLNGLAVRIRASYNDDLFSDRLSLPWRVVAANTTRFAATQAGELRKVDDGQSKVKGHKAVTLKDVGLTKQEVSSWKPFAVPEKVLEKAITIVKQRDGVLNCASLSTVDSPAFVIFLCLAK